MSKRPVEKYSAISKPISKQKSNVHVVLTAYPKATEYLAYPSTRSFGHFYNRDDPTTDYFYKCLVSLTTQHKQLIGDLSNVKYITTFTPQGFKFKCKVFDYSNKLNKLCKFKLQIKPYDFVNEHSKRIAGLSIRVISIRLI